MKEFFTTKGGGSVGRASGAAGIRTLHQIRKAEEREKQAIANGKKSKGKGAK